MNEQKGGQMKELDFDELHQQVSKLMDQAAKPKSKKNKPLQAASAPAKQVESEQVAIKKPTSVAADTSENTSVVVKRLTPKAPIVLPKRKGVAMDMVVKPKVTAEPPSARPGRTAPTLQPTQKVTPEAPTPIVPQKGEPDDVSDDTLASLDLQADLPADIHAPTFPDPLDVHGFTDSEPSAGDAPKSTPPTMQHTTAAVEPIQQAAPERGNQEPEAPSLTSPETPFVHAKVEKRPLGAFADADQKPAEVNDAEESPATTAEAATIHETSQAPLKELSPEVVAVESAEPEFTPQAPDDQETTNMDDLRQMAIPQQYKTQEKQTSHEPHHVFDTKAYHPPLDPIPAVRRSPRVGGLLTLVLVILVVIAAVGAYFFTIGGLDITKIF